MTLIFFFYFLIVFSKKRLWNEFQFVVILQASCFRKHHLLSEAFQLWRSLFQSYSRHLCNSENQTWLVGTAGTVLESCHVFPLISPFVTVYRAVFPRWFLWVCRHRSFSHGAIFSVRLNSLSLGILNKFLQWHFFSLFLKCEALGPNCSQAPDWPVISSRFYWIAENIAWLGRMLLYVFYINNYCLWCKHSYSVFREPLLILKLAIFKVHQVDE